MKRIPAILAVTVLASGCVTPEEQAARQQADDRARCASFGYQPGSVDFADCMMAISFEREDNARIDARRREREREMREAERRREEFRDRRRDRRDDRRGDRDRRPDRRDDRETRRPQTGDPAPPPPPQTAQPSSQEEEEARRELLRRLSEGSEQRSRGMTE
ncbi:MAG: hypothetical protein K5872_21305 [Rhizobiaceae bacterium]|nr:hypothetical protein [Rhizobiaceae bacterium]MCV0408755.1 hypothetical protein [Rhizobiaceae bacterium]